MSILKPQISISQVGSIRNEIMLFCLYNMTKKHELLLLSSKGSLKVQLNPNQTHVCCVCRHMAKLCTYILYKSISLRNVIKEKHHSREGVQSFTMEFHQVSEKSYLQHTSQYLLIQLEKHIFVERIYQLRSFDTKFIGCHLSCLLLASQLQANEIFRNKFDMCFECSQLASWHAT